MLLKTIFYSLFLLLNNYFFYLFLFMFVLSYTFLLSSLRNKFLLFTLIVLLYSMLGFLLNLDGIILIFILTEFTIVLLLLMTYIQLYINYSFFLKKKINVFYIFVLIFIFLGSNNQLTPNFYSYYKSVYYIVSSDFFILFYILFLNSKSLVILVTVILSFFSFFFILFYFSLKEVKNQNNMKNKNLYFLRKQVILKQTTSQVNTTSFQV